MDASELQRLASCGFQAVNQGVFECQRLVSVRSELLILLGVRCSHIGQQIRHRLGVDLFV